jgi:hypothetical protein
MLTIAPGLRSDQGDVRQRVGPMAGHQRVDELPTCPVADTADRRLGPLGPTDGDRKCVALVVAVADGAPRWHLHVVTSRRLRQHGAPCRLGGGARTACVPALRPRWCADQETPRAIPSPRQCGDGQMTMLHVERRTRLFESKMTFHVEQPGRPRLPAWSRFPRPDTRGHCSSRVSTLSTHARAPIQMARWACRSARLPARPVNVAWSSARCRLCSTWNARAAQRRSASPAADRPRLALVHSMPGPNRPRLRRGPFRGQ